MNINDSFDLQVKDSTGSYVSLFGGDVSDVTVEVGNTGATDTVIRYTIIAMGSLTRLTKEIWDDNISQDEDGNQIYTILLNFSTRYRNNDMSYKCLKDHKCIFFGYEEEYHAFCSRFQLDCEHLKVRDALALAQVINSVKLVIGNQSINCRASNESQVSNDLRSVEQNGTVLH